MTAEEARRVIVEGINYAAYKETDSALHDSDKNHLLGFDYYDSGRTIVKPSPWAGSYFEEKMAMLLCWANVLNRSTPAFSEAQTLLEGEDSVIGRVIRYCKIIELQSPEPYANELPRWIQVPVGLLLGLFALFCALASLSLLFVPNKQAPGLAIIVGLVLVLGCSWVLEKSFRLITGRKRRGGLMSPLMLRIVSYFLLIIPIAGIFTGYYRGMGAIAVFQAVMYIFGFLGLSASSEARGQVRSRRPRQTKDCMVAALP